jgi:hypothetical protein
MGRVTSPQPAQSISRKNLNRTEPLTDPGTEQAMRRFVGTGLRLNRLIWSARDRSPCCEVRMAECPFLNDPSREECDAMTRLENVDRALHYCCDRYKSCAVYWMQVQARMNGTTPAATAATSVAGGSGRKHVLAG